MRILQGVGKEERRFTETRGGEATCRLAPRPALSSGPTLCPACRKPGHERGGRARGRVQAPWARPGAFPGPLIFLGRKWSAPSRPCQMAVVRTANILNLGTSSSACSQPHSSGPTRASREGACCPLPPHALPENSLASRLPIPLAPWQAGGQVACSLSPALLA